MVKEIEGKQGALNFFIKYMRMIFIINYEKKERR